MVPLYYLAALLFIWLISLLIKLLIKLIRKYRLKAIISIAAIVTALILAIVIYNVISNYNTYKWVYEYKPVLINQYPIIYNMDVSEKVPTSIIIGLYIKSSKPSVQEQDAIANTVRNYLISPEGQKEVNTSYFRFHQGTYTKIIINFCLKGSSNTSYAQYESVLQGYNTWSEWDKSQILLS